MGKHATNLDEIRARLESTDNRLKEIFHVEEIGVFGSYATGKQTRRSDIDILVSFSKGHKDFFNYVRLKDYLEELLGHKVDLVMREAVKERLRKRIFNEVVNVR